MKRLLKGCAYGLALILITPILVPYWLLSSVSPRRREGLTQAASQLLSLLPGKLGSYLRIAFFRRALMCVGADCYIGFGTILATHEISLGDRVYIGPFCNLGHVDIGNDVLLGSNVTVLSGNKQHCIERLDVPMNQQGGFYQRVQIEDDCWLGNGSIVMASVATQCVVAAGAVVVNSVEAGSIIGGNPARLLRSRYDDRQSGGTD